MSKIRQPKKERVRVLRNQLSDAWCLSDGLAPVKGKCVCYLILFVNILLPGFGTMISACVAE